MSRVPDSYWSLVKHNQRRNTRTCDGRSLRHRRTISPKMGVSSGKQIALSQEQDIRVGHLQILSQEELKHATNDYDADLVVGSSQSPFAPSVKGLYVANKVPQDC